MDKDLKEALDMVKYLRAALGLAIGGDAVPGDSEEAEKIRGEAADLLRKHGESDDEMDVEFEAKHGIYPQEAH